MSSKQSFVERYIYRNKSSASTNDLSRTDYQQDSFNQPNNYNNYSYITKQPFKINSRNSLTDESKIIENNSEYSFEKKEPLKTQPQQTTRTSFSASSGIDLLNKPIQPSPISTGAANATATATSTAKTVKIIVAVVIALLLAGLITFCVLYFGVLFKYPGFREACDSFKTCATGKNLTCNNTCVCGTNMYWDGSTCSQSLSFGSTCLGGAFQCVSTLSCVNQTCQCANTTYLNGNQCSPKLGYGSICSVCSTPNQCPTCLSCSQCREEDNLYCNTTDSKCYCSLKTHYYDPLIGCVVKGEFNRYCTNDDMCSNLIQKLYCRLSSSSVGTTCPSQPLLNYCTCPTTHYYNGSMCLPLGLYNGACSVGCECDTSRSLFCDSVDDKCNCPSNYYWDGSYCRVQKTYTATCITSNECYGSKGSTFKFYSNGMHCNSIFALRINMHKWNL